MGYSLRPDANRVLNTKQTLSKKHTRTLACETYPTRTFSKVTPDSSWRRTPFNSQQLTPKLNVRFTSQRSRRESSLLSLWSDHTRRSARWRHHRRCDAWTTNTTFALFRVNNPVRHGWRRKRTRFGLTFRSSRARSARRCTPHIFAVSGALKVC